MYDPGEAPFLHWSLNQKANSYECQAAFSVDLVALSLSKVKRSFMTPGKDSSISDERYLSGSGGLLADGGRIPYFFSTAQYEEPDRFGAWREAFVLRYYRHDIETPDRRAYGAEVLYRDMPSIGLTRVTNTSIVPCRVFRTPQLLRDGDDMMVLTLCLEGELNMRFGDDESRLGAGGAMLTSRSLTGGMTINPGACHLDINISRDVARRFLPALERFALREIETSDPSIALLRAYVSGLMTPQQALPSHMIGLADRHIREILAAIFNPLGELARAHPYGGIKAARLLAIRDEIAARIGDPRLNAESVGRKLGVSGRYVQQIMEGAGLSFSTYVRELRLDRARELLRDPRFAHLRITDICGMVGFSDLSPFNRAFRAHFGQTPRDARMGR
jgi:AraC-like DNA-binding protein